MTLLLFLCLVSCLTLLRGDVPAPAPAPAPLTPAPANKDYQKLSNYLGHCTLKHDTTVNFDVVLYQCVPNRAYVDVLVDAFDDFQIAASLYNVRVNYNVHLNQKCPTCSFIKKQCNKNQPTCDNIDDISLLDPNSYHFYLCSNDQDCSKANILKDASQGFVIDTRTMDADDILAIPRAELAKRFSCPADENSSPFPYLRADDSNDSNEKDFKTFCGCMCQPGYENVNGKCTETAPPSPFLTPNHCYKYNSNSGKLLNGNPTNFCSFNGNNLLQPPFITLDINDNYVKYYQNQQILLPGSTVQIPKISFDLLYFAYNYQTKQFVDKSVPVPDELKSVDWLSFSTDPSPYLAKLSFSKPGNYTLKIHAQDYSLEDNDAYNIIVNDLTPPTDTQLCPGYALDNTQTSNTYSYDNTYNSANTAATQYVTWYNAITNNPCGSNLECDNNNPVFYSTYFGTQQHTSILMPGQGSTCFNLQQNDMINMLNEATRLRANPNADPTTGFCHKCCHFEKQSNEKTVQIGCYGQYEEKCLSGPSCGYDGCINVDSSATFFTASSSVAPDVAAASTKAVNYLGVTPLNHEIHYINECETLDGNEDCKKRISVENLISISASFNEPWSAILSSIGASPLNYLSVRYSIDGSAYVNYDPDSPIVYKLDRLVQPIDIEIRTPCGILVAKKTYKVYQHPYHAINLCYTIETRGFYSMDKTGNKLFTESLTCNYPNANFAEFSFTFDYHTADAKEFNGYAGYSDFKSITCAIKHEGDTGNGVISNVPNVTIIDETSNSVTKHFALQLLSQPTSQAYTPVTVSCSVKYNGFDNYVHEEICSKSFAAKDCDTPTINLQYGNPAINPGTCGKDCLSKKLLLPQSACGGNIIDFDGTNTTFHANSDGDLQCCQDCGASECKSIMKGPTLKKCDYKNKNYKFPTFTTLSFAEVPKRFLRTHGMLAFMTVGISISGIILAVGLITLQAYRNRQRIRTEDGYSPLI